MTALTRDVRDRAVQALRDAHATGRKKAEFEPWSADTGGVCTCVIIAEALGVDGAITSPPSRGEPKDAEPLYQAVRDLGFPFIPGGITLFQYPVVVDFNDAPIGLRMSTFAEVADMVAALEVVDEAEAICRDALVSA